jgi:hypothetical protein
MRTAAGTMRVYRKDQLFHRDHEALHTTGLWYAEPITWKESEPAQRGYSWLGEALLEAQMIEDWERQARLSAVADRSPGERSKTVAAGEV